MKFGYLRKDNDGHDYVIPEELIEEFDKDYENTFEKDYPSEMDWYNALERWNDKWWKYAEGGSVSHYKVVIPE